MVEYKILYSKFALKDAKKLSSVNLSHKAKELIELIKKNPFPCVLHSLRENPPSYDSIPQVRGQKLVGNLNVHIQEK